MSYRFPPVWGVLALPLLGFSLTARADVFINELHYDDSGSPDTGEMIEVAGPAGADLGGWKIVLYNGSNTNSAKVYDTIALAGRIPATCGGYGVVAVAPNPPPLGEGQIQNGPNDGLALVDATGAVVQLLSYEGTFIAGNGPAAGMTSVDIGNAESNSTPIGHSLQLSGNGTHYADFTWQNAAANTFGGCNTGQTFGTPVDVPPTVASTLPANNANSVALNSDVRINFSEPVSVAGAWFDLTCTQSGAHAAIVSGGPQNFVLTPESPFLATEACTVTVRAALVYDQDGTPDPMAADYVFGFQTVGDYPPTVVSTVPANNAGGVAPASNITVNFSEPVTLGSGWFTLGCDASGAHSAVVSGGPVTYTLNPNVDFSALEICTFAILAAQVHDQDGTPDALPADVAVRFTIASDNSDYYAGADTSSGPALKAWLHNRIKDHTAYPYSGSGTNTWTIINAADQDPLDPNKILDIYKNDSYTKISGGTGEYNREHTWPKSLGFPNPTDGGKVVPPHTDGHMLHASHVGYNGDRGNNPYADCTGCTERATTLNHGFGGGSGRYPGNSNWFNASSFEVWNHQKGDMARAVMYMTVRYKGGRNANGVMEPDLELTDNRAQIVGVNAQATGGKAYMGLRSVLLAWHELDPPDEAERLRDEVVYSFQHNRNPFIDHPEWARCLLLDQQCPVSNDPIFGNGFESPTRH